MLALAFLAALAADATPARPADPNRSARSTDPIDLTVPEIRHLLSLTLPGRGPHHRAARPPRPGRPHAAAAETGTGGEQPPAVVGPPIEWLRIDAKRHTARVLQTVKLRAFNPRATEWQRMHAVAARFHLEHGHLEPPTRPSTAS
ncbi:hypothetical protein ACIG0C_21340 [Kitasatospora aureofaciens]|uniref:Uncharacterized protein n=1 Tax=Kitasatospora aureofaciens TaxID=1894 RepID=A0A1E7N264_KITAU|nr:hypothetical protein [Kitasatospora aureofaciens]OEV34766.1 hypothetical protein HS99_0009815 [Kitasatospora aureofaciens]GGU92270.1 hypothetical protein GCM10010502_52100 [Kitasatospora aureofaciens]